MAIHWLELWSHMGAEKVFKDSSTLTHSLSLSTGHSHHCLMTVFLYPVGQLQWTTGIKSTCAQNLNLLCIYLGVFVVVWALVVVCKLLIAVASLVTEPGLQSSGLNSCGSWA